MSVQRYPEFKGKQNGIPLCRGCGELINEPRRRTWHAVCWEKYEPTNVKNAVWKREQGICQRCGKDMGYDSRCTWRDTFNGAHFHHIIPFKIKKRWIAEETELLCEDCHKMVHRKIKSTNEVR